MPRVSREQAECHRREIIEAAARLFRERGIDGASVSDLMNAAGLTHGGFYGHFESKESLAAAACALAFDQSHKRWNERATNSTDAADAHRSVVDGYLSNRARDNPGLSCPTAALVNDVAREPEMAPVRATYIEGVKRQVSFLSTLQHTGAAESDRRRALVELATLAGALIISRATRGDPLSEEFLAAARDSLLQSSAAAAPSPRQRL